MHPSPEHNTKSSCLNQSSKTKPDDSVPSLGGSPSSDHYVDPRTELNSDSGADSEYMRGFEEEWKYLMLILEK